MNHIYENWAKNIVWVSQARHIIVNVKRWETKNRAIEIKPVLISFKIPNLLNRYYVLLTRSIPRLFPLIAKSGASRRCRTCWQCTLKKCPRRVWPGWRCWVWLSSVAQWQLIVSNNTISTLSTQCHIYSRLFVWMTSRSIGSWLMVDGSA